VSTTPRAFERERFGFRDARLIFGGRCFVAETLASRLGLRGACSFSLRSSSSSAILVAMSATR
jgi:hypothetical protein